MEKTKCWLFVFVLLFAGAIAGSVAIMNIANNQIINDFSLDTVEGYDESVIADVVFNVKYELCEDGYYEWDIIGSSCEFQYSNKMIHNLELISATKKERIGTGVQMWEALYNYYSLSDYRAIGNGKQNNQFILAETYASEYSLPKYAYIFGEVPEELYKDTGEYKYFCDRAFWIVEDDVYFFEYGVMYRISKNVLLGLKINKDHSLKDSYYFEPFYVVPDEIDTIVGFKGGELLYLVGIGDVTSNGYTLYHYTVDVKTGETINRKSYEKILSQAETVDVTHDSLSFDYLPNDSYDIVTITQPSGYQDTFVVDKKNSDNDIYQLNLEDVLGDDFYISGLLETASKGTDTLYLMYAEGQIGKLDYTCNWARRVIMDLENRIPMECPSGYDIGEVGFNGIAFVAIEKGEVIYKGYFTSDTYRAMGYTINSCLETGQYAMDIDLPKAYIESITISVP